MNKEKEFIKLLQSVSQEYFDNRKLTDNSDKRILPFIAEMNTTDLIGDELIWKN